jgi:hypothetical protein
MRKATIQLLAVLSIGLVGCQAQQGPRFSTPPAAALSFTPPVALEAMPLDLDRESRQSSAYVGYDSAQVTTYYVRTDDRMRSSENGWSYPGYYDRRVVSTTVSTRVR